MAIKVELTKEPLQRAFSYPKAFCFRVKAIHAYKFSQLPPEYLLKGWRCWMSDDKQQLIVLDPENKAKYLFIDSRFSVVGLKRFQHDISLCGDRLAEIKKKKATKPQKNIEKLSTKEEKFIIKY